MARIKIKDLPAEHQVSRAEMKMILGGSDSLQTYSTAFSSFDQKTNQLYNILSSIMKAQKEMESSVTRNIL